MTIPSAPHPRGRTYRNPVYDGYFADPFVLRAGERYLAYGTGSIVDGLVFEVLESTDLASWRRIGGALQPLPPQMTVSPSRTPSAAPWRSRSSRKNRKNASQTLLVQTPRPLSLRFGYRKGLRRVLVSSIESRGFGDQQGW